MGQCLHDFSNGMSRSKSLQFNHQEALEPFDLLYLITNRYYAALNLKDWLGAPYASSSQLSTLDHVIDHPAPLHSGTSHKLRAESFEFNVILFLSST